MISHYCCTSYRFVLIFECQPWYKDIDNKESTSQAKRKHQEILENSKKVKSEEDDKENNLEKFDGDVFDTSSKVDELGELLLGKDDDSVSLDILWEKLKTVILLILSL